MKRIFKTALTALFAAVLLLPAPAAAATEVVELRTYEDLLTIAEDPAGSYRLAEDIDMAGRLWKPVDFTGSFDGGGHTLLNLEISGLGDETATTWDGNYKEYETYFSGLFGTIKGATVENLRLVNVKLLVDTDLPCFAGAVAGYSEESTIRSCYISGRLELRAHDRMFGVGGAVGFGSGTIEDTTIDVTLINTDTDAERKDEQFMGGAYSCGYMDLKNCTVSIDGYISDHGYVHSGGLVGMYFFYPRGTRHNGELSGNSVTGRIRFFEDNRDRRAYCAAIIGETLSSVRTLKDNAQDFLRDEVKVYDVELRPEMCEAPEYTETVTPPGCDTFGWTTCTCAGCGYSYTDDYTLPRHTFNEWTVAVEPTVEEEGVLRSKCDFCDAVTEEPIPRLDPPTPEPVETPPVEPVKPELPTAAPPTAAPEPQRQPGSGPSLLIAAVAAGAAGAAVLAALIFVLRKNAKEDRSSR